MFHAIGLGGKKIYGYIKKIKETTKDINLLFFVFNLFPVIFDTVFFFNQKSIFGGFATSHLTNAKSNLSFKMLSLSSSILQIN